MKDEVFTLLDIIGTAAFSVSGAFAAMEKKLDVFGIFVVAFITAVGGGTIRDVMIGDFPVIWMRTNHYSLVIFVSAAVAIFFQTLIRNYNRVLIFFDSLGLGFFYTRGYSQGYRIRLHARHMRCHWHHHRLFRRIDKRHIIESYSAYLS